MICTWATVLMLIVLTVAGAGLLVLTIGMTVTILSKHETDSQNRE